MSIKVDPRLSNETQTFIKPSKIEEGLAIDQQRTNIYISHKHEGHTLQIARRHHCRDWRVACAWANEGPLPVGVSRQSMEPVGTSKKS